MSAPYNLLNKCTGRYGSCAKWTADLQCIQGAGVKAKTYHGKEAIENCSAISAMMPENCEDSTPVYPGVDPDEIECENGWEITWTNNPSCGDVPWWAEQYDATQE